jgi:nucleoside-diphosphate-sugar epimerase
VNILITGAFGNIGISTLRELTARPAHRVRTFDLNTPQNRLAAADFGEAIDRAWGDIRNQAQVADALRDQDVIIHLIAILPPQSDRQPEAARLVNVEGTRNLIAAIQAMPRPARLIFASSYAVFGHTQHLPPPRTVADPVEASDPYSGHKIEGEALVRASGLEWTIVRFASVLPLAVLGRADGFLFRVPLTDRVEFLHTYDAGLALANAAESEEVWGKTLLIGGGPRCQMREGDLVSRVFEATGIGMLPAHAFNNEPYHTDWLDTSESQHLLQYQRYTLDDFTAQARQKLGWRRFALRFFAPFIRAYLLTQSPYLKRDQTARTES